MTDEAKERRLTLSLLGVQTIVVHTIRWTLGAALAVVMLLPLLGLLVGRR